MNNKQKKNPHDIKNPNREEAKIPKGGKQG